MSISIQNNIQTENICTICRENISENSVKLQCGHIFCLNCITSWLVIQRTCPLCRVNLNNIDIGGQRSRPIIGENSSTGFNIINEVNRNAQAHQTHANFLPDNVTLADLEVMQNRIISNEVNKTFEEASLFDAHNYTV